MEHTNQGRVEADAMLRGKALMSLGARACRELSDVAGHKRPIGVAEARKVASAGIGPMIILALAQAASTSDPKRLEAIASAFSPKPQNAGR